MGNIETKEEREVNRIIKDAIASGENKRKNVVIEMLKKQYRMYNKPSTYVASGKIRNRMLNFINEKLKELGEPPMLAFGRRRSRRSHRKSRSSHKRSRRSHRKSRKSRKSRRSHKRSKR